jgi:hypothetical protein
MVLDKGLKEFPQGETTELYSFRHKLFHKYYKEGYESPMKAKQIGTGASGPAMRYFVLLITGAGICLVLYSLFMAVLHVDDLNRLMGKKK